MSSTLSGNISLASMREDDRKALKTAVSFLPMNGRSNVLKQVTLEGSEHSDS